MKPITMKLFLTAFVILLFAVNSYTQSVYSLNYTVSFPSGETADFIQSTSFRGLTFEGRGFVTDQVSLGGLFTWSTFYEKLAGASFTYEAATVTGTQYRYINAFPILFQAHWYSNDDSFEPRLYLGGGLGTYKINQEVNIGVYAIEDRYWHFGISPEVGLLFPISMDTDLNISFRYHYAFKTKDTIDYSWFGLSIGFAWGD